MWMQTLGSSGAIAQGCYTSSFLVDGNLLLDAGTGVGTLTREAMLEVDHIFITHSHLDHIAALPLLLDSVMSQRMAEGRPPVMVYALAETIHTLKAHIFNRQIWPDFTRLPSQAQPVMRFVAVKVGEQVQVGDALGHMVEVLPASHSVPAVGYAVRCGLKGASLVYTGDTGPNPALWRRLRDMSVAALIIETAFSDAECPIAKAALHHTPSSLAHELNQIPPEQAYPIYITHTKPAETELIAQEIRAWALGRGDGLSAWAPYIVFLQAGQRLELSPSR